MGKGKKSKRQEDFHKVKLKVGRPIKKQLNETKINLKAKQIIVKESSLSAAHPIKSLVSTSKTRGNLGVKLVALQKLVEHFPSVNLEEFTDEIVAILAKYLMESDSRIRSESIKCIKLLIEVMKANGRDLTPVFRTMIAYIKCALTHLDTGVVHDGRIAFGYILDFSMAYQSHLSIDSLLDQLATVISARLLTSLGTTSEEGDLEMAEKFTKVYADRRRNQISSFRPPIQISISESDKAHYLGYDTQQFYWSNPHDETINFSFPASGQDNARGELILQLHKFLMGVMDAILRSRDSDRPESLELSVREAQKLLYALKICINLSLIDEAMVFSSILDKFRSFLASSEECSIVIHPTSNSGGQSSKLVKRATKRDQKNANGMLDSLNKLIAKLRFNA